MISTNRDGGDALRIFPLWLARGARFASWVAIVWFGLLMAGIAALAFAQEAYGNACLAMATAAGCILGVRAWVARTVRAHQAATGFSAAGRARSG
ncbi:hypothetical protein [Tautonia rosea]|uniref:hypothetical protein n=1 Tax=Tautonia rosea TaxID=2728037 RepID=UPI001473EAD7|nr:hypothetical protein [Tautonia rosea]